MNNEEKKKDQDIAKNNDSKKYRILTYFKKEPSMGITCISALVVIVAFLVNVAIYLREVAYLDYWKLDASYAFVSSPNQFYRVCGTALHSVIITIAISIVNGAYEAFIPSKRLLYARRSLLRNISKKIRKTEKRLKQIQKRSPKKQTLQERTELRNLEKENKNHKKELNDLRKDQKKLSLDMGKVLLIHLIFTGFLLWIGESLYFVLSADPKNAIWLGLLFASLLVVMFYGIAALMHRKSINKRHLKKTDSVQMREHIKEWYTNDKKYPMEWDWRHYLNDNNIITTILASILYIAMMLCLFSRFGYIEAKKQDIFAVSYHDNGAYVSIYRTDEVAILEKCTIVSEENELVVEIDTQKQKIIPMDEIEYEIIIFDEVKIITSEK